MTFDSDREKWDRQIEEGRACKSAGTYELPMSLFARIFFVSFHNQGVEMSGQDPLDVPSTRWDFLVERLDMIDNRLSSLENAQKHVATKRWVVGVAFTTIVVLTGLSVVLTTLTINVLLDNL